MLAKDAHFSRWILPSPGGDGVEIISEWFGSLKNKSLTDYQFLPPCLDLFLDKTKKQNKTTKKGTPTYFKVGRDLVGKTSALAFSSGGLRDQNGNGNILAPDVFFSFSRVWSCFLNFFIQ